jgi:uncharacterized membrane protein YfcA
LNTSELVILGLASLSAGLVDAVVGGGGLVMVPALFSVFPTAAPATLLGTNKGVALWGTAWASARYARSVPLKWSTLLPATAIAPFGSALGAWVATITPAQGLRIVLPLLLTAVLLYTFKHKQLGEQHSPYFGRRPEAAITVAFASAIGFYDGFFGPGTGSFFVFAFVRVLGYDFLHASASAKFLNTATNFASLALFAARGHVWWQLALVMAVANVLGSIVGTRIALRHGARLVRVAFLCVVAILIVKTGLDSARLLGFS